MKHLFFYIVFIFSIFKSAFASDSFVLPNDFNGINTLEYLTRIQEDEDYEHHTPPSTIRKFFILYELGKYFNDKYPNNEIFEDSIFPEIEKMFPHDDEEKILQKVRLLRNGVGIYRTGKKIIDNYISNKIAPPQYKKVKSYDDYDHPNEVSYIKPEEGKFVKVYNFKRFLTYSNNPEERKAILDFERENNEEISPIDKIDITLKKLDIKKIPFYGYTYENPLLSKLGTTQFSELNDISIRLLSKRTYIDNKEELDIGINIKTKNNTFIVANNVSEKLQKPQISLQNSTNVEKYQISYPIPQNSISNQHIHKYYGDILIPLKIKISDTKTAANIKTDIKLSICNNNLNCYTEIINLELPIDPKGKEFLSNGYENFIQTSIDKLPRSELDELKLTKFVIDENNDQQSLRLEFKTTENIESFKIFIENKDEYSMFSAPLINIKDNKAYVRFIPIITDINHDYLDNNFIITASLNNRYNLRTEQKAVYSNIFDIEKPTLNLGIIFFAFLGGLILNLMPCVFPVLSLKIISLSHANITKSKYLKKSLFMTFIGIFSGFSIIIIFSLIAKYLGTSLGWGMQFQNMGFLVFMTFTLSVLLSIFPQINFASIQQKIINKPNNKYNFLIGNLIVLLSTPCTGPYLATAIGFALAGSYTDIIIILYGVALGLAFPYILAYSLKEPQTLFPKPGPWLNKIQLLMKIMLYLTIIWFLSLILGQTNWICITKLLGIILIFVILFNLYIKFLNYLDGVLDEKYTLEHIETARKKSTLLILGLFIISLTYSITITNKAYKINQHENMKNKVISINEDLIKEKLNEDKSVLLEIGADWCMTCHYNKTFALNKYNLKNLETRYNLELIKVDWTNYNKEVLDFMEKYGRKGLPFYILYTPIIREGVVLPEVFTNKELDKIIFSYLGR